MMQETDTIPKQYYTIGEVAKELELSTSQIRFWETEFKEVNPKKNRKGNRIYTQKDFAILKRIHFLLKVKQFTIKGARERLRSDQDSVDNELKTRETLLKLRSFLLELKESL